VINIEKAIKFPYSYPNWTKTVGVYFIVVLVISLLSIGLQITLQLPADILQSIAKETNEQSLMLLAGGINMTYIILTMVTSIVILPITIYLSGYVFDVVRHIVYEKEPSITLHGKYTFRLKLGIVKMVINLIVNLTTIFLVFVPIIPAIAGAMSMDTNRAIGITLYFFSFLMLILWLLLVSIGRKFLIYAMEYLYLTEGFSKAMSITSTLNLISNRWKLLLRLFIVEVLTQIFLGISFIVLCVAFFVFPIVTASATFSIAYVQGEIFKQLGTVKGV
jgi:hypothetical protein